MTDGSAAGGTGLDDGTETNDDDDGGGVGGLEVDRRTLLGGGGLLGLLTGGTFLALQDGDGVTEPGPANATTTPTTSTTPAPGDDEAATIPEDHVPFDVWADVQDALRTSPDHLPARAEALVEAGDPEAIFEFVRDDVATVPPGASGMDEPAQTVRWGTRGTLRCGAGTPREKANLLVELYERAGYDAQLVWGWMEPSEETVREEFLSPVDRSFDPDLDEETVQSWLDRLDVDPEDRTAERVDPDGADSAALANRLRENLPEPDDPLSFDWEWPGRTLLAELTVDGETRYANPFFDVPFGEHGTQSRSLDPIEEPPDPLDVEVTLSASTADDSPNPFELVSGQWDAEDLVGRQLLVRTVPSPGPFDVPAQRVGDLTTYVPTLAVRGPDEDRETLRRLSEFGDAVTVDGDRLTVGDDGEVLRNDQPFVGGDAGDADPSQVASVSVDPNTSEYPTMKLGLDLRDEDGNHVTGLPGDAFSVTDDGERVASRLRTNAPVRKVALLFDNSGSMPPQYSGEDMGEFLDGVEDDLRAVSDHVTTERIPTRSDNWSALADAMGRGADFVVYATDHDVDDDGGDGRAETITRGVPTLMLSVTDEVGEGVGNEDIRRMADLSGGEAIPAADRERTREVIRRFLAEDLPTAHLEYYVPDLEDGEREVEVTIPAADVGDAATYQPPDERVPVAHRDERLCGLYLTVSVGSETITRTLAGWDPQLDEDEPVTDDHVTAVESALLGGTTLSFEGEGITPSVAFDDYLAARRDAADVDTAVVEGDAEDLRAAREEGVPTVPLELLLAQGMLPTPVDENGLTYHDGLRIAMTRTTPLIGTDRLRTEIDVLPFGDPRTAAADAATGYRTTMDRTARVDVVEAATFDSAAGSLLVDRDLVGWDDLSEERQAAFQPAITRSGIDWNGAHWLFPAEGPADAFFTVDATTGEVHGVLADGTGGGESETAVERRMERINEVLSNLNLIIAAGGPGFAAGGGLAVATVASYGQRLARLYASVSASITLMEANDFEEDIRQSLGIMMCELKRNSVLGLADSVAFLDALFASMGGNQPLGCSGDVS